MLTYVWHTGLMIGSEWIVEGFWVVEDCPLSVALRACFLNLKGTENDE
jgi:hypothetical protein